MENHVRLFQLIKEVTTHVLQQYLKNKFTLRNCPDLPTFLQRERHTFFHLTFPNLGRCCGCSLTPSFGSRKVINKPQFEKFYLNSNTFTCGSSARTHSCQFTVKSGVNLEQIDVTCGSAILFNVFGTCLTQQEENCLKDIREVRNAVAHHSTGDFTEREYNTLKGKLLAATTNIAKGLSSQYDKDVQEKIVRILQRIVPVGPADYVEFLHYLLQMKEENNHEQLQLIDVVRSLMETLNVNIDRVGRKIDRTDLKIDRVGEKVDRLNARPDMERPETRYQKIAFGTTTVQQYEKEMTLPFTHGANLTDEGVHQTAIKVIEATSKEDEYSVLYSQLEKMKVDGKDNNQSGENFALLAYITLCGNTTSNINMKILQSIHKRLYGRQIQENANLTGSLELLVPEYIEEVDGRFTISRFNVAKSVVNLYATVSVQSLIQICTCDIILEYILPETVESDEFFLGVQPVSANILVNNLIKRLIRKGQANLVGKYIAKVFGLPGGGHFLDLFVDAFEKSEINVDFNQMIKLLDGMTRKGQDFKVFQKEKIFNVFSRKVDDIGSTIFHTMSYFYNKNGIYKKYISFFAKENHLSLLVPDNEGLTTLYHAAYMGRYGVISTLGSNIESLDADVIDNILSGCAAGAKILQRIKSKDATLETNLKKRPLLGILKILKESLICLELRMATLMTN